MKRPDFAVSNSSRRTRSQKELIGVQGTEAIIKHALELINMFINDYCYEIDVDMMLEQMLNYSYQEKKKFDIIAAMGMAEIADEELTGVTPSTINDSSKE